MDFEKDIDKIKQGFYGEELVRNYLINQKCKFSQIDIIALINDVYYSIEIKHQEPFRAPPFDGHGLPVYQKNFRIKLYEKTGIVPLFFVLDMSDKNLYYNSLLNLEKGNKFITGVKKRVIYPIENFKTIDYK